MSGFFTSFEAWAIYTVLFLGALGYILNKTRLFVLWCWHTGKRIKARADKFDREWDALNELIQYQLGYNGGHSLLDMIRRIDSNHVDAETHWTNIEKRLSAIEDLNQWSAQVMDVAFKYAPIEQQTAVTEWAKLNPPPRPK
jgi:hypothetical protein